MKVSTTIDSAGRILVPVSIRRRFNLAQGSRLRLEVVAERIVLTPECDPSPLVRSGKRLILKPSGKRVDAAAAVRAERDARQTRASAVNLIRRQPPRERRRAPGSGGA